MLDEEWEADRCRPAVAQFSFLSCSHSDVDMVGTNCVGPSEQLNCQIRHAKSLASHVALVPKSFLSQRGQGPSLSMMVMMQASGLERHLFLGTAGVRLHLVCAHHCINAVSLDSWM